MRKVLRVMLWMFAVACVLLVVAATVLTNPVKARPFASGVSADPSRLRSDVEALTGLPGFRCFERPDDLERAAEWVRSALEASGLPVEEQVFGVGQENFRNFIRGGGSARAGAASRTAPPRVDPPHRARALAARGAAQLPHTGHGFGGLRELVGPPQG